jgi:Tfp pilus assembly protein PilX
VIAVDATGALQDRALAQDVSGAALRAAEHTITAGGRLRMVVFAGDANSVEVIYDDGVPTLEKLDETRRGPMEQQLRGALAATLDSALGVNDANRALTERVRARTRGGTSDIARAMRNGLRTLEQRPGAVAMTLVSDGAQASDQLMLARRLQDGDSRANLARQLGDLLGSAKGIDLVQAVGLGRLPDRVNQSARRTDELVQIWMTACEQTGATSCNTTTEL